MMKWLLIALGLLSLTACAGDGLIHIVDRNTPTTHTVTDQAAVPLRLSTYIDARNNGNPRLLGTAYLPVSGISGKEILLDQEVSQLVTSRMAKQLEIAGFKIVTDDSAKYELSGVIKQLRFDVTKKRNETALEIDTTVKEIANGKTVWSGSAKQTTEIDVPVSGTGASDITQYVKQQLGLVTKKTSALITANMTVFHPAPNAATPTPVAASASGQLKLSGSPARAKIYVDGIYFGLLPLSSALDVGIHDISVKAEGYQTAAEKISIRKDETTELEIKLAR